MKKWIKKYYKKFGVYPIAGGGGGGEQTVTSHTYYYYKIKFAHSSIDPSQTIIFYDAFGNVLYNLPPYYQFMNYGQGILSVPGSEQNITIENVSTATYYVFYSSDSLVIDYERAEFRIAKSLIKFPSQTVVKATYEYLTVITAIRDVASVIDGRWDTQVQTQFFAQPPTGYNYAIIDLGAAYEVQALDIVAGFFKPDDIRRFDIDMSLTIEYSLDNVDYYIIGDKTTNFKLTGGDSMSFEEDELGAGLTARYFKLILEDVKKIDYGNGVWVVALTEVMAYNDIVLKSEATLIPATYLTATANIGHSTLLVESTVGFDNSDTIYIRNSDGTFDTITYTSKTNTTFNGVTGIDSLHSVNSLVVKEQETDTTYYDYEGLLPKLKDRLFKDMTINENILYSQSQLDYITKGYLKELVKNHNRLSVDVVYSPHLRVGQTINIVDPYNNTNANFFIEEIRDNSGFYNLTLARYPS